MARKQRSGDFAMGWCVDYGHRIQHHTTPAFPDRPMSTREFGATLYNRCLDESWETLTGQPERPPKKKRRDRRQRALPGWEAVTP